MPHSKLISKADLIKKFGNWEIEELESAKVIISKGVERKRINIKIKKS